MTGVGLLRLFRRLHGLDRRKIQIMLIMMSIQRNLLRNIIYHVMMYRKHRRIEPDMLGPRLPFLLPNSMLPSPFLHLLHSAFHFSIPPSALPVSYPTYLRFPPVPPLLPSNAMRQSKPTLIFLVNLFIFTVFDFMAALSALCLVVLPCSVLLHLLCYVSVHDG